MCGFVRAFDANSNDDIQHRSPSRLQGKRGIHPTDTISGGWGSDVTISEVEEIRIPEAREKEPR